MKWYRYRQWVQYKTNHNKINNYNQLLTSTLHGGQTTRSHPEELGKYYSIGPKRPANGLEGNSIGPTWLRQIKRLLIPLITKSKYLNQTWSYLGPRHSTTSG